MACRQCLQGSLDDGSLTFAACGSQSFQQGYGFRVEVEFFLYDAVLFQIFLGVIGLGQFFHGLLYGAGFCKIGTRQRV